MKPLNICTIDYLKSFLLYTALLITGTLSAQNSLPDSRRNSEKRYIYNISVDNLRKVYLKDRSVNEDMLQQPISEYFRKDSIPKLSKGNYMIVEAIENRLNFTDHTVDDLF